MFSDTLELAREHLETGSQVVLQVEATMESEQLKLLGRSVTPIDALVQDAGAVGLRIFIEDTQAIDHVATVLQRAVTDKIKAGRGPIYFNLMAKGLPGEVEIDCGVEFPVNPQIKGALRSLDGVIEVEEV